MKHINLPLNKNTIYFLLGDIHGRVEILKEAHQFCKDFNATLICVGDYVDSFFASNQDILCCLGNHDLQYIAPRRATSYQCSGFSKKKWRKFNKLYFKINSFWFLTIGDKYLITHAGVTNTLVDRFQFQDALEVSSYLESYIPAMNQSLFSGTRPEDIPPINIDTGIYWCRPKNFVNIPGVIQIFGHTPDQLVRFKESEYYNIDFLHEDATALVVSIHKEAFIKFLCVKTEHEKIKNLRDRGLTTGYSKLLQRNLI
jgi:hypothetical protein